VAGADGFVSVRFQKIVEELHVELVVFHDQDGLRHPCSRPLFPNAACPGARTTSPGRPRSGNMVTVVRIPYEKANPAVEIREGGGARGRGSACDSGAYLHCRGRRSARTLP